MASISSKNNTVKGCTSSKTFFNAASPFPIYFCKNEEQLCEKKDHFLPVCVDKYKDKF